MFTGQTFRLIYSKITVKEEVFFHLNKSFEEYYIKTVENRIKSCRVVKVAYNRRI